MAVKVLTLAICGALCFSVVSCQRPSYAGSRPPNGNKDKYRPTQSPQSIELANRFGDDGLGNGVSQRPPQGVPVVTAEETYIPIQNNPVSAAGPPGPSGFSNRINTDSVVTNTIAGGSTTAATPSRLPLDAHGDQQLIDHLNTIPIDNRPFWFINYQAIEAQRNGSISNFGPIASRGSFFGK